MTCLSIFLPSKIDFDLTESRILVYSDMQHSEKENLLSLLIRNNTVVFILNAEQTCE